MNEQQQNGLSASGKQIALCCGLSVMGLWLAQPPLGWWPLVAVALVPWFQLARDETRWTRRNVLVVWAVSAVYFLVSLQGLRHAHPLMIFPTLALAGYLAVYHVLFLLLLRRTLRRGSAMILVAPVLWVGLECVRNYLLTGLSALMLAHSLADVPIAIQIADLFGSYGISFVVVAVNVGVEALIRLSRGQETKRVCLAAVGLAVLLASATIAYGVHRLQQPLGEKTVSFALIQRSEPIEYVQSDERAVEIFQSYLLQSQDAVRTAQAPIAAIVWPESMFTAGLPWMMLEPDAVLPAEANVTRDEFAEFVNQRRSAFSDRVAYTRSVLKHPETNHVSDLLVGCGVVRYSDQAEVYSGVVHIEENGDVRDWYGKTHLVMFGEYIPIAPWIPGVRDLIPPGMGLTVGPGARVMKIDDTAVLPLICIETAVERVTVNQLAELRRSNQRVDVLVTVTNDGWFDDSSVVDHHLRCGQLVAVATRRPLLSAANNGPTVWIDSNGQIVDRLEHGSEGAIIATPQLDGRESLYVRIGAWPAWACVLLTVLVVWRSPRDKQSRSDDV